MKSLLVLLAVLFITKVVAGPVTQETADRYIRLATLSTEASLIGDAQARSFCMPDAPLERATLASADTVEEAALRLQLVCVKRGCAGIGEELYQAAANLRAMPLADLRDFLEFSGTPASEIEQQVTQIHQQDISTLREITCATARASQRRYVVDKCLTRPLRCASRD